jgi:hypothetical protein
VSAKFSGGLIGRQLVTAEIAAIRADALFGAACDPFDRNAEEPFFAPSAGTKAAVLTKHFLFLFSTTATTRSFRKAPCHLFFDAGIPA